MRFVDCQGLGGHGTSLGAVRAGFEMIHRASLPGGFGDKIVDSNRKILRFDGDIEVGEQESWTAQDNVAYVTGTPPCSGFSMMNTTAAVAKAKGKDVPINARGPKSAINMCQRALVQYAARCTGTDGRLGADFVSFESVQGAFSQGIDLMREYRQMLSDLSGQSYDLVHVKMSVASIGGPQWRHRYFWLAHRSSIKFGIDPVYPTKITTLREAIGDLEFQPETWAPQAYVSDPTTEYQKAHRGAAVLQHLSHGSLNGLSPEDDEPRAGRAKNLQQWAEILEYWPEASPIQAAALKYLESHDRLPEGLDKRWDYENRTFAGFMWPFRTGWDRATGVLTGGCAGSHFHPDQPRFLTVRELSRVMDIPDDWTWEAARHTGEAGMYIGKCCTTGSGTWMARAVMDALSGSPQSTENEFFSDGRYAKTKLDLLPGERVYDITNEYRKLEQYKMYRKQVKKTD